jgi:integrase
MSRVDLLPELLQKSRAETTCRKYENSFNRWRKWAFCNGLGRGDILPAKPLSVSLYLCSIIQSANSSSSQIAAFYSIKWYHDLHDLKSPTDSKMVQNVLEAGKRIHAKPINKKEPVTGAILTEVYKRLYEDNNAKNQRIICACLVAFAGFLRSSELLNILISDIIFEKEYMGIFMETSKTDQYRDGAWVVIARIGTLLCPVANVEKLIQWACLKDGDYLFCNLSKVKGGFVSRACNKKMSYSNLREQFKTALKPHVSDISKYCLHSLRAGGATAAAQNGIKDRLFKRHGRWLSDTAKDGYVKDSLKERLFCF